jgi:tripartite-type tricarboxylate transporter receptor subunit TctC
MRATRRHCLALAALAAALPGLHQLAWAQTYPLRAVRLIVGFPPGGAGDVIGRLISPWLSQRLGQQFVIDNHPGAGGNAGTELVVRAAPDGYTLLMAAATNAINATLYPDLTFNFVRDIVPVASIGGFPFVMVVNPSLPARSVAELIAYAKANPGKINMASPGAGTGPHVAGELFKLMASVDLVHVPYRGSYLPDLLGGQVQVSFAPLPQAISLVRDGKLRPLAVTTARRLASLPDVPAIAELVPGYEASGWYGVGAPRDTSLEIIDKLNQAVNAALADRELQARYANVGVELTPMTPAAFGAFIEAETEKWAKVVRFANIKPE